MLSKDEIKELANLCGWFWNKDHWEDDEGFNMDRKLEELLAWISSKKESWRKETLEQLEDELRDYRTKVPEANYHDIMGYIAGFRLFKKDEIK